MKYERQFLMAIIGDLIIESSKDASITKLFNNFTNMNVIYTNTDYQSTITNQVGVTHLKEGIIEQWLAGVALEVIIVC